MVVVGVKTYFIDQFKPSQVRDDQQLVYTQNVTLKYLCWNE